MPSVCSVFGCKSQYVKGGKISFYTFPKDQELARKWVKLCKRKGDINLRYGRVCSQHFAPEAFQRNLMYELLDLPPPKSKIRILKDAVPTLHLPASPDPEMQDGDSGSLPPTVEIIADQHSVNTEPPERKSSEKLSAGVAEMEESVGASRTEVPLYDSYGTHFIVVEEEPPHTEQTSVPHTPPALVAQEAGVTKEELPYTQHPDTRPASPLLDEMFVTKEEPPDTDHPHTRPASPLPEEVFVAKEEPLDPDHSVVPDTRPESPATQELLVTSSQVGLRCFTTPSVKQQLQQLDKNKSATQTRKIQSQNPASVSMHGKTASTTTTTTMTLPHTGGGGAPQVPLPLPSKVSVQGRGRGRAHPKEGQYLLVKQHKLDELLRLVRCRLCGGKVNLCVEDEGFDATLRMECLCDSSPSDCEFRPDTVPEDPRVRGHFSELNLSAVYHSLVGGKGFAGLQAMARTMRRPCMASETFQAYAAYLYERMDHHYSASMEEARWAVQQHYLGLGCVPDALGFVGIDVLFGWTDLIASQDSLVGIGLVMEADTGVVLDFEVLTTCSLCTINRRKLLPAAFELWFTTHSCHKNFDGQEGAMGAEAAVRLWQRSTRHGFYYTTFVGDGPPGAYQAVRSLQGGAGPYSMPVFQEEGVSQVSKRFKARLRHLMGQGSVTTTINRVLKDGTVLTDAMVMKLTSSFAAGIRNNSSAGVEAVQQAVWATLQQYLDTVMVVLANKQHAHHGKNLPYLRRFLQKKMEPIRDVFREFTRMEVIRRCLWGGKYHPGRFFLPKFWLRMPRPERSNLPHMTFVTRAAILEHNFGREAVAFLASLNFPVKGNTSKRKRNDQSSILYTRLTSP